MKLQPLFLFALCVAGSTFISGCKKVTESAVDCFAESLLVSVRANTDATNSKLVNFEAHYIGDLSVSSVVWDFGDGTSQTATSTTSSHTYLKAGNYTVKAKVALLHNGSTCTPEPTQSIVVD